MGVDLESFSDILKHPIRRKIILTLNEGKNLSYSELMAAAEVTNTGKFNYHLKVLGDLIEKDSNGRYNLTEKGKLTAEFFYKFPDKNVQSTHLSMADALLIGFAGFTLTLANPGFWVFMLAAFFGVQSVLFFSILQLLTSIFAMVGPGALMWLLATRRANSHDPYNLYKGPLFMFLMLIIILVPMLVLGLNIGAQVQIQVGPTFHSGDIPSSDGAIVSWSSSKYSIFAIGLPQLVMGGLIFSFLGVAIAELASRIKKKWLLKRYS